MEKLLENLWVVAVGILGWVANRLTAKIDALESDKANSSDLAQQRNDLKDLDKRVDAIDHSTQMKLVPRNEIKGDIGLLHERINVVSEKLGQKQDNIKTIRIDKDKK